MQTDEDGKVYREASLASERYLRDLRKYLRHLVTYVETRDRGERVVGYKILPVTGEGPLGPTLVGKMFECLAATRKAFRAWLRHRCGTVERLRKA